MKKMVLMAAFVAVGTAFVACSSDDDLVQQAPVVPEENVDTPKGTPFSVQPISDATRCVRYNANAWDGTSAFGKPWVREFKLYGKQGENLWMKNVIFQRDGFTSTTWAPVRDATGAISVVNWPADDPETTEVVESAAPTSFYAITDNAINASASDKIANVDNWMTTLGSFEYTMPTTTKANMEWIDETAGMNCVYKTESTAYMDSTKVTDLMVASAETNEAGTTGGVLDLAFTHALAGLTVKARFLSDYSANKHNFVTIQYCNQIGQAERGRCHDCFPCSSFLEFSVAQHYVYLGITAI